MKNYGVTMIMFIATLFIATTVGASSLTENNTNEYDDQVSPGSPTAAPTAKLSEYTKLIKDHIASQKNIPIDRLLSINEHRREYPDLRKSYWYVKAIDLQTHQIYDAMADLEGVNIVTPENVEKENAERHYQKYGKLDPQLYDALQLNSSNDAVNVAVWFKSDLQNTVLRQLREDYPEIPRQPVDQPWLMVKDIKLRQSIQKKYLWLLKQYNLSLQEELAQQLASQGYFARQHPGIPSLAAKPPK